MKIVKIGHYTRDQSPAVMFENGDIAGFLDLTACSKETIELLHDRKALGLYEEGDGEIVWTHSPEEQTFADSGVTTK